MKSINFKAFIQSHSVKWVERDKVELTIIEKWHIQLTTNIFDNTCININELTCSKFDLQLDQSVVDQVTVTKLFQFFK